MSGNVPLGNTLTTVAGLEPSVGRVVVEDASDPTNTRFLHVLQGADSNAVQDTVTYVAGTGGNAFEGATVRGTVTLFPVNVLSNNFTSLTYSVPDGITNHYIAGLTPDMAYAVNQTVAGGRRQVAVTPGNGVMADYAGLLSFNNAGQTLSGAPIFTSATKTGSSLRVAGVGMANLTYNLLASTNLDSTDWTNVGTVNADMNGNFQFTNSTATSSPYFYRVS